MNPLYKLLLPYLLLFPHLLAKRMLAEAAADTESLSKAYSDYSKSRFYEYKKRIQLANDILLYYTYSGLSNDHAKKFSLLGSNFSLARIYIRNIVANAISFTILRQVLFMLSIRRKVKTATTPFPERRAKKAAKKSASTTKNLEQEIRGTGSKSVSDVLAEQINTSSANSAIKTTLMQHFKQSTLQWLPTYITEAIKILEQQYKNADNETAGEKIFLLLRYLELIQEQQQLNQQATSYGQMARGLGGKVRSIIPRTKQNLDRIKLSCKAEEARTYTAETNVLLNPRKTGFPKSLFFYNKSQKPLYAEQVATHVKAAAAQFN